MAITTLTLEDLPDGTLRLSLDSEPPLIAHQLTPAQTFMLGAHALLLNDVGAPISDTVPVTLLDDDTDCGAAVDEVTMFNRSHQQRPPHE